MNNTQFEQTNPSKLKKVLKTLVFILPMIALTGLFLTGKIQTSNDVNQRSDQMDANSDDKNDRKRDKNGDRDKKDILIPIETSSPETNTLYAFYNGTASLYAENKTEVASKTSGQIIRVFVEEGDTVKSGQHLAQVENDRLALEVKRLEANLNKITQEITRKQELYEQKLIPRDSFESLRYDKQSAEAALSIAKLDLDYTRIKAPISGIISARMVQRGNAISVNQAVYEITSLKTLQADLFIPERELNNIKTGQIAQVRFDAINTSNGLNTVQAKVKRISPIIDSKTGTFKATLEIENLNATLKPGMFGRFNVIFDEHKDVMTIPRTAIQDLDGEQSVYTIMNEGRENYCNDRL